MGERCFKEGCERGKCSNNEEKVRNKRRDLQRHHVGQGHQCQRRNTSVSGEMKESAVR